MGNCCATGNGAVPNDDEDMVTLEDSDDQKSNERRASLFPNNTRRFSIINPTSTVSTVDRRQSSRTGSDGSTSGGGAVGKKKELKLLLLGTGESGKSTIVKQMKIIHEHGFTAEELENYRTIIYRNIYEAAKQVLEACRRLPIREIVEAAGNPHLQYLDEHEYNELDQLPGEMVRAIQWLWLESGIRNSFTMIVHGSYILDSAQYFFDEIERIGQPNYVPTQDDVLKARIKTTGISEYHFKSGPLSLNLIDLGGQRPERKQWIAAFDSVTTIIFCVALSEYDQELQETPGHNRLLESFQLFEYIINSRWFVNTSIVLFLNKKDIFARKLRTIPLAHYFRDYTGGADVDAAIEYIKQRFLRLNRNRLQIYPFPTQATDTQNISLVFSAVKETVLMNSLRHSGLV